MGTDRDLCLFEKLALLLLLLLLFSAARLEVDAWLLLLIGPFSELKFGLISATSTSWLKLIDETRRRSEFSLFLEMFERRRISLGGGIFFV